MKNLRLLRQTEKRTASWSEPGKLADTSTLLTQSTLLVRTRSRMFCCLVGVYESLTMSHIRVTFPEPVGGVGPSLLQSILGRLKSPSSMIGGGGGL